jgi:hypothetical protein
VTALKITRTVKRWALTLSIVDGWTLAATLVAGSIPIAALGMWAYIHSDQQQHEGASPFTDEPDVTSPKPAFKFTRDVAVNVIANLVAAAIIYLAAALAGLLPRSPGLLFAATIVILTAVAFVIFFLALATRGRVRGYFFGAALTVLGIAAVAAPFVPGSGLDGIENVTSPVAGAGTIWMGMAAFRHTRRVHRERTAWSAVTAVD